MCTDVYECATFRGERERATRRAFGQTKEQTGLLRLIARAPLATPRANIQFWFASGLDTMYTCVVCVAFLTGHMRYCNSTASVFGLLHANAGWLHSKFLLAKALHTYIAEEFPGNVSSHAAADFPNNGLFHLAENGGCCCCHWYV